MTRKTSTEAKSSSRRPPKAKLEAADEHSDDQEKPNNTRNLTNMDLNEPELMQEHVQLQPLEENVMVTSDELIIQRNETIDEQSAIELKLAMNDEYSDSEADDDDDVEEENRKADGDKSRRRLPVSIKELIDYHSSNGKSIKEIVDRINLVCKPEEKISYGYVQKYLYRKRLEATTAKKARYYRKKYGFVYRRMRRKPILTDVHRQSRIQWCQAHLDDQFGQDVFIGKTTLKPFLASLNQLKGQAPDPTQPRQQTTLHLWGAISRKGASPLQIFDGPLTTAMYLETLLENVVPFIAENFPTGHRFHQDNNPKHSAKLSQEFLSSTGINWVKSPPRSHDLNPIELVWTELIQNVAKRLPKTLGQVIVAVKDYWKTLTPDKCSEFIDKLSNVVPKVLEKNGEWVSLG